jgi:acetaldehyde dehydrogenase (acetylating)
LIDASSFGARSPIAATVPRADFEEALGLEEVPELVLGVDSRSNGDVEAHTLRVAWTEDQLRELLRDTTGDDITLYFDADELQRALADEDIEAHGVREKSAAVITVAAMAVGVGATAHAANAQQWSAGGGGSGSTIEMVSDAASSGVQAAPELISDAGSSGGAGVEAAQASGPELISDAASGPGVDVVRASGPELISDAASGPGVYVPASTDPELVSDAASTGTLSAAQSQVAAYTAPGGGGSSLSATEIAGTAAIGGVVLLITAAGFAVRGRHRGGAQPA